jgi:hypothetical protein
MNRQRNRGERGGGHRPGPQERARVPEDGVRLDVDRGERTPELRVLTSEEEADLCRKCTWAAKRQRQCRQRRIRSDEVEDGLVTARRTSSEPDVNGRAVGRAVQAIVTFVENQLAFFEGPLAREAVLLRVFSNPICSGTLTQFMSKELKASQEVVAGLAQSLSKVKHSNSKVKLVTKHAILTAAVSSESGFGFGSGSVSQRQRARLLHIHPRNLTLATKQRIAMDSTTEFAWVLSVRKIRKDAISEAVKAIAIAWWLVQTQMSPNRNEVVSRRISACQYIVKPIQYLLESTVPLIPCSLCILSWAPYGMLCLVMYLQNLSVISMYSEYIELVEALGACWLVVCQFTMFS